MGERDTDGRLSWWPAHATFTVKTHPLAHTDRLASAMVQRIDVAGHRGRLYRHPFEYIRWLLHEALDAGVAIHPVTQGHKLFFFSLLHNGR